MCVRGCSRCGKGGGEGPAGMQCWLEKNQRPVASHREEGGWTMEKEMKMEEGGWRLIVVGMGIKEVVAEEVRRGQQEGRKGVQRCRGNRRRMGRQQLDAGSKDP